MVDYGWDVAGNTYTANMTGDLLEIYKTEVCIEKIYVYRKEITGTPSRDLDPIFRFRIYLQFEQQNFSDFLICHVISLIFILSSIISRKVRVTKTQFLFPHNS
jgi:hypothetical protein